jgi:hypothetical protein
VVCDHRRGQHPSEPLNSHEERNLVMRHEPSGSCPLVQPAVDRRHWPSRAYRTPVALRDQQPTLHQIAHQAEPGYLALLVQPRRGSGDAA